MVQKWDTLSFLIFHTSDLLERNMTGLAWGRTQLGCGVLAGVSWLDGVDGVPSPAASPLGILWAHKMIPLCKDEYCFKETKNKKKTDVLHTSYPLVWKCALSNVDTEEQMRIRKWEKIQENGLTNSTLSKWSCCLRWLHTQRAQWVRQWLSHDQALLLVKMLQQLSTGVWVLLESKKNPALELFQFSRSVMSDSLQPHGLRHTRLPCPSPTPGACSNSCPSSWWCHPTISSSVVPFSSCLQSFPASGCFPVSQFWSYLSKTIHIYWALRFVRHWAKYWV